jgi:hypothetical protein
LRYTGMLDDAQRECNTALSIDPGNFNFRSCAFAFFETGDTRRALDFIHLDAGSEWSNAVTVSILLREGKVEEARQSLQAVTDSATWMKPFVQACLSNQPGDGHKIISEAQDKMLAEPDSELKYYQGALLAYCGERDAALKFLHRSIEQHYCSYVALQRDPLLDKLRSAPGFGAVLASAQQCQKEFLAARAATAK